jgi:biopolymer transport protein ExbB/TolQ
MTYVRQSGALEPSASSDQSHSNLALDVLVSKAKNSLDVGWFVVDILIKLGLLGTIIGFILMLASVSVSDNMDVTGLQSIIKNMSTGMGTALYTTLAGLLASILLALQYLLIERGSDALIEGSVNLSLELFPPCTAD